MNARTVGVKPCLDVLAQAGDVLAQYWEALPEAWAAIWEALPKAWAAIRIALRIKSGIQHLRERFRRRRPKTHRVAAQEIRAHITFGAPTAAARVSISPPDWL